MSLITDDGFADDVLIVDGLVFFSDGGVEGLRAGNVTAINLTVSHFEGDFEASCGQLAGWHARLGQPDSPWRLIESAADIAAARADGKVGLIMGWQNMRRSATTSTGSPSSTGSVSMAEQKGTTSAV